MAWLARRSTCATTASSARLPRLPPGRSRCRLRSSSIAASACEVRALPRLAPARWVCSMRCAPMIAWTCWRWAATSRPSRPQTRRGKPRARPCGASRPWGTSPIVDAIRAATGAIHGRPGRRAIVLFTDGEDRDDETSRRDALDAVRRSDALVYAVAVGSREPTLLEEFASASGGRVIRPRDDRAAVEASATIAADLQHQYLLGIAPAAGPPGWHVLSVTVEVPRALVRARQGYLVEVRPAGASLERPEASKSQGVWR